MRGLDYRLAMLFMEMGYEVFALIWNSGDFRVPILSCEWYSWFLSRSGSHSLLLRFVMSSVKNGYLAVLLWGSVILLSMLIFMCEWLYSSEHNVYIWTLHSFCPLQGFSLFGFYLVKVFKEANPSS